MASKMEKHEETKKRKRIVVDDESERKPHTKEQKTATESEIILKELAAENHAYQKSDHNEEFDFTPPTGMMFGSDLVAPRTYTTELHTYKIEKFLHVYISKQKDIVLVGLIHFYAAARSTILKPGMKGIYLTVDQYRKLISKRDSISNAIKQIKEDIEGKGSSKITKTKQTNKDGQVAAETRFVISENKMTIVKSDFILESYQVQVVVDIRDNSRPKESYRDIRRLPDNMDKAVILTEKQWNSLLSLHFEVIRDLADNFGYSEDFADELSSYRIE